MNQQQFASACAKTLELVRAWFDYELTSPLAPVRDPKAPTAPLHLAWMLYQAPLFHAEGKIEKANRWLGYVQGVLITCNAASLDELKRANMPDGDTFDPERV